MTAPTPKSWGGWTPKWWVVPLPEWTPEIVPGYAEAKAKLERGESLTPARVKGAPRRRRRTVVELETERDQLTAQRDRLTSVDRPTDTAAARLNPSGVRAHYKHTDAQLVRYTALTGRIVQLDYRIARLRETS